METRIEQKTKQFEAENEPSSTLNGISGELTPEERAVLKYNHEHIHRQRLLEATRRSINRSIAAYADKGEIHPALRIET